MIGSKLARYLHALRQAIDSDYHGSAREARASGGAQADRSLCEDHHRVTDTNPAALRTAEAGRHYVRTHQHLLVGQFVGNRRDICHGVRHPDIFRLAAIDSIAEFPATDRLEAVLGAGAILAQATA